MIKAGKSFQGKIALVGTPNVGKSLLFSRLTSSYAVVSNYPGTTVEVARGRAMIKGISVEIFDTPGMYSLFPLTEEERVARHLLFSEKISLVIHVADAKNLARHLPMTLQLQEAGFRVILVVNMLDEAEKVGIRIDFQQLAQRLCIPVFPTILIRKQGLTSLKRGIMQELMVKAPRPVNELPFSYPSFLQDCIDKLSCLLQGRYPISVRSMALLLLCGDKEIAREVQKLAGVRGNAILQEAARLAAGLRPSPSYACTLHRYREAHRLLDGVLRENPPKASQNFSGITIEPLTGIPILMAVLYFGLYKFVGGFGAGYLVEFLEVRIFENFLIPRVNYLAVNYLPGNLLPHIVALDYGLITLGLRYALAIVLPIVGAFFFFFAFLEDSGYLPRLALLTDKILKKLGLSGRAIIPLALGLGCGTMAVIVTRTLESKRERIIASFLLALAVPCSAQLGLFFGILAAFPMGVIVWAGVVIIVLLAAGALADRLMPGEKPAFYLEVPPLRFPSLHNIMVKTSVRMVWYFREVLPVFLGISLVVSLGHALGLLDLVVRAIHPAIQGLGLPEEMSLIFLLGFLRRDYGAAGLYDLTAQGILDRASLVVAAVTLTLFLPCLAQLAVLFRERGVFITLFIIVLVGGIAFVAGALLRGFFLLTGF